MDWLWCVDHRRSTVQIRIAIETLKCVNYGLLFGRITAERAAFAEGNRL